MEIQICDAKSNAWRDADVENGWKRLAALQGGVILRISTATLEEVTALRAFWTKNPPLPRGIEVKLRPRQTRSAGAWVTYQITSSSKEDDNLARCYEAAGEIVSRLAVRLRTLA